MEMQVKISVRCHFTSTWMAIYVRQTVLSDGEGIEHLWLSHVDGGHVTRYTHLGKQFVSYKGRYTLTLWPNSSSLRYLYLHRYIEIKINVYIKTCSWMFIAALFIIAPNWKQSKCLSTTEWINKVLFTQNKKEQGTDNMLQHGWTSKHAWVKDTRCKRPHIVWFHL